MLVKVGNERIDEAIDPELSIDRAIQNYRRLGHSENWINQRIKSIEVRKAMTDELPLWKGCGKNAIGHCCPDSGDITVINSNSPAAVGIIPHPDLH